ncbi:hypothetical protein [Nocardia sp. bgisy134]|uniref:hypothetical protein n=1 Tax=Nocardia sp. bgisy134 TaxID=3413789 RepID=UPI003D75A1BE
MVTDNIGHTATSTPTVNPDDEATRLLASAAHLDPELADAMVEECLAEPYRVVLPSPGVRAHIVLREAVAARTARRIGSAVLVALLVPFTIASGGLVVLWLASGSAWKISSWAVRAARRSRTPAVGREQHGEREQRGERGSWWPTALLWLPLSLIFTSLFAIPAAVLSLLTAALFGGLGNESGDGFYSEQPGGISAVSAIGIGTGLLITTVGMFCVLFVQRYRPWVLADRYFRFGHFQPDRPPREFVSWACRPFATRLQRIIDQEQRDNRPTPRNLIIYRGHRPFVGAGTRVRSWSQAFELRPNDPAGYSDAPMAEFAAAELQNFVARDVDAMRKTPNITPGWRFAGLEISDTAFLSAGHVLNYREAEFFARELKQGRNPQLAESYWQELLDSAPEWLRFYRCFRLEGWARQLGVAGYLHIGYERQILFVEWNGFVLPPVAPTYHFADFPPRAPALLALWQALGELALLPTTIPARVIDMARWMRDAHGVGRGRTNTPDRAANAFGALATVREIGAGTIFPQFFQESDSDQYLKILERRVLDAIHRFLSSKGIATDAFDTMITQINNATVMEGCTVVAGNIGGADNIGTVGSGTIGGTTSATPTAAPLATK